jgi:hypothetical protein
MSKEMRLLSWNVNSDRRVELKTGRNAHIAAAFPDLTFKNRWPLQKKLFDDQIDRKATGFFAIQEASNESAETISNYFTEKGYTVVGQRYCPNLGSFNYVFAYKPEDAELISHETLYFTTTGKPLTDDDRRSMSQDDKKAHNFGIEFERSAQILKFRNSKYGEFIIVNVHPGLPNEHRLLATQKLVERLTDETCPKLLAGDFNQFDMRKSEPAILDEQVKILTDSGFSWVSEHLKEKGLKCTFISAPYDINRFFSQEQWAELDRLKETGTSDQIRDFYLKVIKEKNVSLPTTCLDAVFSQGFETVVRTKSIIAIRSSFFHKETKSGMFKPYKTGITRKEAQEELLRNFEAAKEAPLASDHVATLTKF